LAQFLRNIKKNSGKIKNQKIQKIKGKKHIPHAKNWKLNFSKYKKYKTLPLPSLKSFWDFG
jgi:hypothetical protein